MADYSSVRLSGLFRTKRKGMYVGNVKPDQMEELQAIMNGKKAQKNGLVLFLFKADGDNRIAFTIFADAAKPYEGAKKRRPIEDDNEDSDNEDSREEESEEEEEEEERPRKKSKRDEDEDEDEAPRKKSKKSRGDDDDDF